MKLEKKLCKVFKDILESRETNRIFINPFALKQNAREISDLAIKDEYKSFNSSYKMIIYNLQSGNKNNIPMQILAKPAEKTSKVKLIIKYLKAVSEFYNDEFKLFKINKSIII